MKSTDNSFDKHRGDRPPALAEETVARIIGDGEIEHIETVIAHGEFGLRRARPDHPPQHHAPQGDHKRFRDPPNRMPASVPTSVPTGVPTGAATAHLP